MKYYCKNCGSEFKLGERFDEKDFEQGKMKCGLCFSSLLVPIPDYETPQQYEKRTGKAYPDNGLLWIKQNKDWLFCTYKAYKKAHEDSKKLSKIVIADPPVPPPDGWKPEVNNE
jgi:DNA-directed RNA polymerase subunit RPC12/RpoP